MKVIPMSSGWSTVWEIAGKRHETKQGEDHLTDHAHTVLQAFVMAEAQENMRAAMGGLVVISRL